MARRLLLSRPIVFAACAALALNQIRLTLDSWGKFILAHPGYSDFGSYYLYAHVGMHEGWSRLYDLAAQRQEWLALGGSDVIPWFPIIYPPPVAWIVTPFASLPLPIALACWLALLVGLMLITWGTVARGWSPMQRWTALAMAIATFPVLFAIVLGQVLVIQLVAVALAWWLLGRGKEIPAGLLLTAIVFKPQLLFLLPAVLIVTGRWRAFVSWSAGTSAIAMVAVLTTGIAGLSEYAARLAGAAAGGPQYLLPAELTLTGIVGRGFATTVLQCLIVVLALGVAFRHRREGAALPVAAGITGSMLITPYLHEQDLSMLLLAAAIALHAPLGRWLRVGLLVGYIELLAISYLGSRWPGWPLGPTLVVTEALLLLAAWRVEISGGIRQAIEPAQIPLDRTA